MKRVTLNEETAQKHLAELGKMLDYLDEQMGMPDRGEDAVNVVRASRAIVDLIAEMKGQLRWSEVLKVDKDNTIAGTYFIGSALDCTNYVIEHPELKGQCIVREIEYLKLK